jgi:uncharacterized protein (TIGR02444 family)
MTQHDDTSLWDFALKIYSAPGVSEACLALQDESGVDVPVLLFGLWLGAHSVELPARELRRIDGDVGLWREEVVRPLRAVRRRLKTGPFPAPSDATETLRNNIKAAELNSEKIELALLEAEGRELMARAEPTTDAPGRNAAAVVRHYRGSEPDASAQLLIDQVLRAL